MTDTKNTVSDELLPCPFCGCTDISPADDGHSAWLACDWCGATSGFDPAPEYEGNGVEWHWNRRLSALSPRVVALEWHADPRGGMKALAAGLVQYRVRNGNWYIDQDYMGKGDASAAQADYAHRILSAIEVSPSPRVVTDLDGLCHELWANAQGGLSIEDAVAVMRSTLTAALSSAGEREDDTGAMTPEEIRLEDLKQMAKYEGPIVSFDFKEPFYLASCDRCGWVGSSELCGTDSFGDDSDVYCPRCFASGADCGKVAKALSSPHPTSADKLEVVGWIGMDEAPKDGTLLHLLVSPDDEAHTSFHDSEVPYETIGFNQFGDTGIDEWQFAGWDWSHDCITQGYGEVIGWLPFHAAPSNPVVSDKIDARLYHLHVEALAEIKATVDGESEQPVKDIIYGLLDEIAALSVKPSGSNRL